MTKSSEVVTALTIQLMTLEELTRRVGVMGRNIRF